MKSVIQNYTGLNIKHLQNFVMKNWDFQGKLYMYILSILKLISQYNKYFTREKAVEFGHKKMRHITEGVNAIEKSFDDFNSKEKKKIEIFEKVKPSMASTEIEALIEDVISDI
jgi:ribosomal 50S subunit-associated protein YjgA (DUF615 family)